MTIQLRRRHYYTWLILATLLPILVLWAYFNIPEETDSSFKKQESIAFPTVLESKITEQMMVKIRSNNLQKRQLEVTILKPIEGVANQIHISNSHQNSHQVILGSIESTGVYRFLLPDSIGKSPVFISIFDIIKQKERIKFVM